jgi:Cu/Ag efflux protein CusF
MALRFHPILFVALVAAGYGVPATAATPTQAPTAKVTTPVSAAEVPLTEGLVKKVDKVGKKVTLSHGPLPGGMPAMTMAYRVKDAAWLDQMKEGQKIRFAADPADGGRSMLRFELVK